MLMEYVFCVDLAAQAPWLSHEHTEMRRITFGEATKLLAWHSTEPQRGKS